MIRGKMKIKQVSIIICSVLLVTVLGRFAVSTVPPLTYERSYPNGSTTNDESPNNIITVDAIEDGQESSISLSFYIQTRTLIMDEVNVRNITLYYNRVMDSLFDTETRLIYKSYFFDELNVVIHSQENTVKNLTIHNLPRYVESISYDDDDIIFVQNETSVTVSGYPGHYVIRFTDVLSGTTIGSTLGMCALQCFESNYSIDLIQGWNLISISVIDMDYQTLVNYPGVECVAFYDNSELRIIMHGANISLYDYPDVGQAIFVYASNDISINYSSVRVFHAMYYTLCDGWNLVSLPFNTYVNSTCIFNANQNISAMVFRDDSGHYNFIIRGSCGEYLLNAHYGYYLFCESDFTTIVLT